VPPVASEVTEGVLGEPAAGTESVVVAPPLPIAVADVDALPPSITGTDERAAEVAESSSLQPATSVEEVAPTKSQPLVIPQECDAPEGVARATSPEIQETGRALVRPNRKMPRMAMLGSLTSPTSRGRLPSRLAMTARGTRCPRLATPSSMD
jgi:hypothetical protein